jgi:hypothetical protein
MPSLKQRLKLDQDQIVVVNLSGRRWDVTEVMRLMNAGEARAYILTEP